MVKFFRVLIAAAALVVLPAASADQVLVTIKGLVGPIEGHDTTGVFGAPHTSLLGMTFELGVLLDLSLGQRSGVPGVSDSLIGGPALGLSNPVLDTTLTINGAKVHIPISGHVVVELSPSAFDIDIQSTFPGLVLNHVTMFLGSPTASFSPSLGTGFGPVLTTGGEDFRIQVNPITGGEPLVMANGQLIGQWMTMTAVDDIPPLYAFVIALPVIAAVARRRKR